MKKSVFTVFFYTYTLTASATHTTKFRNQWVAGIRGGEKVTQKVIRDQTTTYNEQKKRGSFETIPAGEFSTQPIGKENLSTYSGTTKIRLSQQIAAGLMQGPYQRVFNDPLWRIQWYVQDFRTHDSPVMDHNVVPVYKMGITGKGVLVMVVDNGIVHETPDLKENFLPHLSYDFCRGVSGCDPPKKLVDRGHGTECAGVIGMVADNNICGVGIAYDAKIAGARIDCFFMNGLREAQSLVHQLSQVDIYSCSWGDVDDGETMVNIGYLSSSSIKKGIKTGRKGKGAIYVFAAGNGKTEYDNCAADSYVNFIGTIAITSATDIGSRTNYGERCSAIFATTFAGNGWSSKGIATTTEFGGCTDSFTGTSAATPIASGIIALTLQANPELTYRDVMHLIAMTSEVAPLADNENSWYKNGRGFWVSNDFGFGLLNAENMVIMAKTWKKVPEKKTCVIKMNPKPTIQFKTNEYMTITIDTTSCKQKENENVVYLEEFVLTSTIKYIYRGAIKILVRSPAGTETTLLQPRKMDANSYGLYNWSIKSVHNWGEDPRGEWTISVVTVKMNGIMNSLAEARKFTLTLYGTSEKPAHYDQPRKYAAFRLPNGLTPWS